MSENYEFSSSQNEIFENTAKWLTVLGVGSALLGIVFVLVAVMAKQTTLYVSAGVQVMVTIFLLTTSKAFKNIVTTKGNDIEHAMEALRSLRGYFFIQAAALIIEVFVAFAGMA